MLNRVPKNAESATKHAGAKHTASGSISTASPMVSPRLTPHDASRRLTAPHLPGITRFVGSEHVPGASLRLDWTRDHDIRSAVLAVPPCVSLGLFCASLRLDWTRDSDMCVRGSSLHLAALRHSSLRLTAPRSPRCASLHFASPHCASLRLTALRCASLALLASLASLASLCLATRHCASLHHAAARCTSLRLAARRCASP